MKKISLLILFLAALSSCNYQVNNKIEQPDLHEGDERIYGDGPKAPARQLAKQYEASAKDAARTEAIKEKLYGK